MKENLQTWRFSPISEIDIETFCDQYARDFDRVTCDAFNSITSLTVMDLKASIQESTHIGLVEQCGDLIGFCLLYADMAKPLRGKLLVWINKVAISRKAQGQGYGVDRLLDDFAQTMHVEQFGFVGCSTQSYSLINKMAKLGKRTYGLTAEYGTSEGIAIWTYLTIHIEQLKGRFVKSMANLDDALYSNYGILKGAYGRGINAAAHSLNPQLAALLNEREFEPEQGDMLVLLAEL
jgi:GNAT superfamily N-acetyltransferase